MVYVVNKATNEILFKIDAWVGGADGIASEWAFNHGYTCIGDEITMMGDMVIWVK